MEAILDTGSSDFILISSSALESPLIDSSGFPRFNEIKSATFKSHHTNFNVTYSMGASSQGTWAQDWLSLNDMPVPDFNFGLAYSTNHDFAVAGIGPTINDGPGTYKNVEKPYSNLLMQLKESGAIEYMAYSIWLNSKPAIQGHILFGGIDKNLHWGKLYRFPIVESINGIRNSFTIKLDKVYLVDHHKRQRLLAETSLPVLFDTGTPISWLPQAILQELYIGIGAVENEGYYTVPCQRLAKGDSIGFVFSGIQFKFSFQDIAVYTNANMTTCMLGFMEHEKPILGLNVLRLLYVVYDLENLELGIARGRLHEKAYRKEPTRVAFTSSIDGVKAPGFSNTNIQHRITPHRIIFRSDTWLESQEYDEPLTPGTSTTTKIG